MAEDAVNQAMAAAGLGDRRSGTEDLAIHGPDAEEIRALIDERPELAEQLHPDLPYRAAKVVGR